MPTTIQSIETFPVIYPVEGRFKFFESPAGRPMGRPAVVIKITADDGTVGWGESAPSQRWS
ncbi:MAG: L-alanine-DL-glutamate epimerase-like enolase superfamily enzyme, partial [Candidatus Binatia bacterium]